MKIVDTMKITILCDQKDCIHNTGNKVHHDHPNDKCTHHHPIIDLHPIGSAITICHSKEVDKPTILPSCQTCETPTPDNCVLCCHQPKDTSHDEVLPDACKSCGHMNEEVCNTCIYQGGIVK